MSSMMTVAQAIQYFPYKGVARFYDIGGLLLDPGAFALCICATACTS